MSNSRLSALNVIDFHYVSSFEFKLLLFNRSSAWDIIDVLLISHEFGGLRLEIGNALKVVGWI